MGHPAPRIEIFRGSWLLRLLRDDVGVGGDFLPAPVLLHPDCGKAKMFGLAGIPYAPAKWPG